jgi:hypothetical protein
MIEEQQPRLFAQLRGDLPPHVLVTSEAVGKHHHRAVVTAVKVMLLRSRTSIRAFLHPVTDAG